MQNRADERYEFILEAMIALSGMLLLSQVWVNRDVILSPKPPKPNQENIQKSPPNIGNEKPILPLKNMKPPGRKSSYGWRIHPILKTRKFHNGHDVGALEGTPILSILSGKVTFAGWKGACGNTVIIESGDYSHTYCHIKHGGILVHKGQHVKQGDVIAQVGSTGRSTGPHLHLGIKRKGQWINPLEILPGGWY